MALDLLDQAVFTGVLRSCSAAAGCAFIDCPETRALFSRDLTAPASECQRVPVGERVSFRVSLVRGQPSVHGVAWPPVDEGDGGATARTIDTEAGVEELSGFAAVLAHKDARASAAWSESAVEWREAKETRAGMGSLLAHADGPGRTSGQWRPSVEADDRSLMRAALAHRQDPEHYPLPQVRQGTFVGWKSN